MSINLSATSSASNDSSHLMNALKPRPAFQVLIMWEESRLGREQLEVGYVLKQIIQAGVEVWFYLENRQRTLDSPIEKIMLSLTAFADELERERARQRTRDAMLRKAQAGHVTGGWCFGYRNIEITGADGRRSYVDRAIDVDEADIIRQIFTLCAEGRGIKTIAKLLNAQHAPSPRAQRGRSRTWAPSSVRDVLFRPIYRGEIVWAASAKRDRWGQKRQASRPEADWIRRPTPQLRIVSDELWNNAHARLTAARAIYFRGMNGQAFGRPPLGNPSKYLLSNLAACGCCCGGSLRTRSRSHGRERALFYVLIVSRARPDHV
jgi:site-specific DNA recombinase